MVGLCCHEKSAPAADDITTATILFGNDKGTCYMLASCTVHEFQSQASEMTIISALSSWTLLSFKINSTKDVKATLIYQRTSGITLYLFCMPLSISYKFMLLHVTFKVNYQIISKSIHFVFKFTLSVVTKYLQQNLAPLLARSNVLEILTPLNQCLWIQLTPNGIPLALGAGFFFTETNL